MRNLLRAMAKLPKSSRLRKFASHSVKPTGCNPWALNLRKRGVVAVQVLCALLWSASISTRVAAAQEKYDPAALAKTIAPFVDEQAIVVGRIDLARIEIDPVLAKLGDLVPDRKEVLPMAKAAATIWTQTFLKAGARDIFAVFTLSPGSPVRTPILVIPLRSAAGENAIRAIFPPQKFKTGRIGDALVAAETQADLEWARQIKPDPRPELAAAFEAAGDSAVQLLLLPPKYTRRVIEETMPELPKVLGGGPSSVFTRGARWAAVGIDLPPRMAIRAVVQSQDAQAAEALRARWVELLRFAGQDPELPRFILAFDQVVKVLTPKVEADRLVWVLNEENKGTGTLLSSIVQPVIGQARTDGGRAQSADNLRQIGVAMLRFPDSQEGIHRFPAAASYGADGKPLLSWRVLILPYLEQESLYKEFHLNEPWDSQHNKTLIAKMPPIYRSPMSKLKEPGRTNYVVAVGPGTVFGGREGMKTSDIKDGMSYTILTVEVADAHAVIWTKPEDLAFDPKDPAKGLGGVYPGGFYAVFCDSSVLFVPLPQPAETLRRMFEAGDGKPVNWP